MGYVTQLPMERAVQGFMEAAVIPDHLPLALDGLARAMGSRGALLSTPVFKRNDNPVSSGIDDSFSAYMEEGWDKADERAKRGVEWYLAKGPGFFCEDMLFTRDELRKSTYFNGFAKKQDVPWFAAAPLVGDVDDYVAIAFNRRAKEGHFTRDEINRLNKVLPTLQVAGLICQSSMAAQQRGMLLSLQLIDKPAFLLDWQGKVLDHNARGEAFLGGALHLSFGRLKSPASAIQHKIDQAIGAALRSSDDTRLPAGSLDLGSELQPTTAKLQIMRITGTAHDVFCRARVLAVVSGGPSAQTDKPNLEKLFGFSPRESELAALLAQGRSIREASVALGIGEGTVRFYVKSILSKTGTHRQAELVHLLLGLG